MDWVRVCICLYVVSVRISCCRLSRQTDCRIQPLSLQCIALRFLRLTLCLLLLLLFINDECSTGQGAPRGVPVYRTTPFVFRDTEHAANLFALKELGNIYSRLMNPTTHVLESRYAQLEGGHALAGLAMASGTNAIFYAILNLAQQGDNIVSASALYGGTYT